MKDIKELALKIADSLDPTAGKGCGKNYILTPNNVAELCTRFLAAYTEGQEPVAWDGAEEWEQLAWNLCAEEGGEESCTELLWDGGPIPEPWGYRWLKYEGEAKRMISLVRKFTAPPTEPAPQMPLGVSEGAATSACAAPSSEEVREMVERLRSYAICTVSNNDAADLIERLAARIPSDCVVVPRDPTEAMILSGNLMQHGVRAAYKSMIAAGEVK